MLLECVEKERDDLQRQLDAEKMTQKHTKLVAVRKERDDLKRRISEEARAQADLEALEKERDTLKGQLDPEKKTQNHTKLVAVRKECDDLKQRVGDAASTQMEPNELVQSLDRDLAAKIKRAVAEETHKIEAKWSDRESRATQERDEETKQEKLRYKKGDSKGWKLVSDMRDAFTSVDCALDSLMSVVEACVQDEGVWPRDGLAMKLHIAIEAEIRERDLTLRNIRGVDNFYKDLTEWMKSRNTFSHEFRAMELLRGDTTLVTTCNDLARTIKGLEASNPDVIVRAFKKHCPKKKDYKMK